MNIVDVIDEPTAPPSGQKAFYRKSWKLNVMKEIRHFPQRAVYITL